MAKYFLCIQILLNPYFYKTNLEIALFLYYIILIVLIPNLKLCVCFLYT